MHTVNQDGRYSMSRVSIRLQGLRDPVHSCASARPSASRAFRKLSCSQGTKAWLESSWQVETFCKMLLTYSEFKLIVRPWERNQNSNPISIFQDQKNFLYLLHCIQWWEKVKHLFTPPLILLLILSILNDSCVLHRQAPSLTVNSCHKCLTNYKMNGSLY